MNNPFEYLSKSDDDLIFRSGEGGDLRLGQVLTATAYDDAALVLIGFPSDEGIVRAGRSAGSAKAPREVRRHLYRLTPFGINRRICDLGNLTGFANSEEAYERLTAIARKVVGDGKKLIVIGGGGDLTYATGRAMSEQFGRANWLGVNIDASFGYAANENVTADSPFRHLLAQNLLAGECLYQIGFQPHLSVPNHFRDLEARGAHCVSLDQLRSHETTDVELRELMRQRFMHHSDTLTALFTFDLHSVRSSEAPGTSDSNPVGLRSGEFLNLVHFAAKLINTKIVEFTEVNPEFDADGRTAKLVAVAIHRFFSSQPTVGV